MADLFAIPEVAAQLPLNLGPVLKSIPTTQRHNVYLHPWHFDLSVHAKFGEVGKYPSMSQLRKHMPSVVFKCYQAEREAIDIKFVDGAEDASAIQFFQVRYIDGHCKGIMAQSILALVIYMAPWHASLFQTRVRTAWIVDVHLRASARTRSRPTWSSASFWHP